MSYFFTQFQEFIEWCCYRLNSFLTRNLNETEELPITRALLKKRGKEYAMLPGEAEETDDSSVNYEALFCFTPFSYQNKICYSINNGDVPPKVFVPNLLIHRGAKAMSINVLRGMWVLVVA